MSIPVTDTLELRKARGAFFTPDVVARYVTEWAVRSCDDQVLEPSCGEAAFLVEAGHRLRALGATGALASQLHGAEIHASSAQVALGRVRREGFDARVRVGDFLAEEPRQYYDAVIGNPPYVRYQDFTGEARVTAKRAALRAGVTLTGLASSWAAFTVHAAMHVRSGGRLGLVLPAEMLNVNYAAPIRSFLMREFARVRLVLFTERVFPGVMEDVVLLLAEGRGRGSARHCEVLQAHNGESLAGLTEIDVRRWTPPAHDRWSSALLDVDAAGPYSELLESDDVVMLEEWGDTTLGMVTGNNAYFALSTAQVLEHGLSAEDVVPVSPPGSRHLRNLSFSKTALAAMSEAGERTWLFRPHEPSAAAQRYIALGEASEVHRAYKCRVRDPWWQVPFQRPADLLLTYMNADTPRLCANLAGVHHLNSVHGLYLRPGLRGMGRGLLALASLNSVSLLGAELVGRSYGGGVLKLEPREADRWPVPSPRLVDERAARLRQVRRRVRALVVTGRVFDASELVDDALFGDRVSLSSWVAMRRGRARLHDRRVSRSKSR
ncbi:MAG TPA: N-6 DNA methylase [Actinomycetales bacterium]|nr:N-6 DNA methylase [Actinomycetales bacterium]